MTNDATPSYKEVFAIIPGKADRKHWTRIGVAFPNKDGSLSLKLDLVPTDLSTTAINIRDPKPRDEE